MLHTENIMKLVKNSFSSKVLKFRHSGCLGDIIYSLPTIKQLGGGILYIDDRKLTSKPLLGIAQTERIIELLKTQEYLDEVWLYQKNWPIDYDLDKFRQVGSSIYVDHLALSHWKGIGMDGEIDLSQPWLEVEKNHMADIVISRTARRWGRGTKFHPLNKYSDRCVFLGFEDEWKKFEKLTGVGRFHKVKSLLDFAQIVAGCKFYVGNQSFGLSLAEGLKVPRFCEEHHSGPNCPPQSSNGHTELTKEILAKYIDR